MEPITERLLNEDIDRLSVAVDNACAQIDRLQAETAALLAALKALANEASAVHGLGLEGVIGITNAACLSRRIAAARVVIAKAEATS